VTWKTAPDGRQFTVYKGTCLHSECWCARCQCGHKLTAHDFDFEGAYRGAIEALTKRDPLNRRDFAHPPEQCRNATAPHPKARR
jgi:hypothetical protein